MLRRGLVLRGVGVLRHSRYPATQKAHRRSSTYHPPPSSSEHVDILIVGSGAGALTAALRARSQNLRVAVIEKQPTVGGASAISGGGLWIPCNPISNVKDSKEDALAYFDEAVGDAGPASSMVRRRAYVDNGLEMIRFLQDQGFRFHFSKGYPDYYPRMKGAMGKGGGRTIETEVFNKKKLSKKWQDALPPPNSPVAFYTNDAAVITRMSSSLQAFARSTRAVIPLIIKMILGQKPTSMGHGLVAQLLYLNTKDSLPTDIRLSTSLDSLTTSPSGRVTGAKVETPSGEHSIIASRGVILAAGGFAHNRALREKHLPSPASTAWTLSPKGDTGDAVLAGVKLGAATALMDDAWWGPTIFDVVTGKPHFALMERCRPHCIIVDSAGKRFMNEAQSYTDAGHDQYERNKVVKALPAWLIMDSNHRNRYMLGTSLFARQIPRRAIEEGKIFAAESVGALAAKIGVDVKGLEGTVQRYNEMCKSGVDEEFGKGGNAYDNFFGDPHAGGVNPNMGPLNRAPFYAIEVWPGDLGTKGGLLTDEHQRVLKNDGGFIPGLYAIGNTAASIMGRTYLGAGSTLGPAMTHGFIAVNHVVGNGQI
ncbi:flavocytochrome c [Colletotrichum karsti]|uniref:Flavocytochrome c n=1 Tax=Colletotrichum karsti TaxID=1095194 RepID=A0A9P6LJT3_9PEZI|nr:flavocytochrome c [Colletotrichum karsti]KAF9875265.1 flavocytochrome c [Colletotrichum karsti]